MSKNKYKLKFFPGTHVPKSNMQGSYQTNNKEDNYPDEEPLRAELFNAVQMEQFGKALAETHSLSPVPAKNNLLRRLADNGEQLMGVRNLLTDAVKSKKQITLAGEWLIDNFYLVEENIRNAKIYFPERYGDDLPKLSGGGVIRIYEIVLKIISHSDARIEIENLGSFIKAYQEVAHLKLGELWAIPIMLRLGLIENIRRVAARSATDRLNADLAGYWAKQMIDAAAIEPGNLVLVIGEMAQSKPPLIAAFVSELTRILHGRGPDMAIALNWIEQELTKSGLTVTALVDAEFQKQAANQASISNSINSLRLLDIMDWTEFVESHSIVEQTLLEDIGGIYGLMDSATRDRYRHVVEHIAKTSKKTEEEIARIAIKLTHENSTQHHEDNRTAHVGYYLVGAGLTQTKKLAKMPVSAVQKFSLFIKRNAFPFYITAILLITVFISAFILIRAYADTKNSLLLLLILLLSLLSVSQLAITVVNFLSSLFVKPHLLPRMDFSEKIPLEFRTLVVVPVILNSEAEIETIVEALEVRYLANRNANLHFGLLTDFADARQEELPGDKALVDLVQQSIGELNKKYGRKNNDLFYLFHRPRHWNPHEKCWMGYERKRGKLFELNALLRGGSADRFSVIAGNSSIFPGIKYVITLDADTELPLEAAWKLVGTMAHPLNHAWYDEKKKRVTKGYGILQPRVNVNLPDETSSLYTRMHANEPGIDPYTRASSDTYQDLFDEGSFIGKGIYNVDIFKKVLDGKFPENSILSHDLLEGTYVRSGLVSDVQLFEKYPASYQEDMSRRSRWIRGDWQIFSWFLPFVPGTGRGWIKNPISGLSRWKIFDNIRRSLVPAALTSFILLGWMVLSSSLYWTTLVSAIIVFPVIIMSIWEAINKPKDVIFIHHVKNYFRSIKDVFIKTSFILISLPHEACANIIAIVQTLWRVLISRRKLLEWDTSGNQLHTHRGSLKAVLGFMWMEPSIALLVSVYLVLFAPAKLFIAGPILLLWYITPFIIWWIGKPLAKQLSSITWEQNIFLRKIARKTWAFFERFVSQQDNWLPPDNYQEQPVADLAHRTSPTNIGLSLLANISAHDFGYISMNQLIDRTSKTLSTLQKMERYNGHFYNWYDTESLSPLLPKYVSTVDSGNLVSHLLILRQNLLALPHQKILSPRLFQGLRDTLNALIEAMGEKESASLHQLKTDLETACDCNFLTHQELLFHLDALQRNFPLIPGMQANDSESDALWWQNILEKQFLYLKEALQIFSPWFLLKTAPPKFSVLCALGNNSTLGELAATAGELQTAIQQYKNTNNTAAENEWLEAFQTALTSSISVANEQIALADNLARQCNELADIAWDFLYNESSNLFTIGYNVQEQQQDPGFYDLLASEARLCSFVCIAQGKVPIENWFALGRLLTNVDGDPILLSWSGSMFEYLMPLLVMPTYENTLLDQTCKAAVQWQIDYGKQTGYPWGVSESGFNMINANSNYQYRAFGAPGLGLKRGLQDDAVIAPYATVMALMISPVKACKNLKLLSNQGLEGRYGFYEAIDYTSSRLQQGKSSAIVSSFMAHHQGMSLLSLAYLLLDKPMQKLFEAEPQFKATLLLLQERIPKATVFYAHTTEIADVNYVASGTESRFINTPNTPVPEVQLLSNGQYHVMVTNAGGGYSRWKNYSLTRWREDGTCDNWGSFCYIRDLESEIYWSNNYQPTAKKGEKYEAVFSPGRADFYSTSNEIATQTIIVVSPEDDMEIRRICITNEATVSRSIEVTGYAEVVLAPPSSDLGQPVFSNLFVQTEIIPEQQAIICTRRPRTDEQPPVMFHLMALNGKEPVEISYETDRMKFIGRGNTIADPTAMNSPGPLSGSEGSVLDPIVAIRYQLTIEAGETITIDMITGIGETKEICAGMMDKYQDIHHRDRLFSLAWTHSKVTLRQINVPEAEAQLYAKLAGSILFNNAAFRAEPGILISNTKQQSGLWGYAISGDLPIVLLKMEKQSNLQLAKQLIQAHAYWHANGLEVELVIWNEALSGYRQDFQNEIMSLIPAELMDKPGGIFVRAADQVSNEDRILFQSVARVNLSDNGGMLADQLKRIPSAKEDIPNIISLAQRHKPVHNSISLPDDLVFFNGFGGFTRDGSEYVIVVDDKNKTPVPWVNVIANPGFGTVISESGTAYTWTENAHELRLTPWKNDPVSDSGGEAFYIRDEDTGHFWSTSLLPAGGPTAYITRHGFGYSVFEHIEDGIYSEMLVYVDLEAAVKFNVLKIRNQSGRLRKLSATGYTEWVLGDISMKTAMHIHTEVDADSGAMLAKNQYNTEFSKRVAFFDVDYPKKTFTADRTEFIGRNGNLKNPDAMSRIKLSGKTGLALDPCAAIQVPFNLEDGEERQIIFRLGAGKDINDAIALVKQSRGVDVANESFEKVKKYWKEMVSVLKIETPDAATNLITNGWLTYQSISSRLWGRTGFYQSGGAFGFRDQLQDVLSLLNIAPELARKQILLCAAHQFKEGDVQHWWHPPIGRGVRTRISDDYLWLPYVTSVYILHTGDKAVLDEVSPFLEGRLLKPEEESYFDLPTISDTTATLYEHCVRAIKHAFNYGEHELPLIGTGDWNDGYDKVGYKGKGESVWMAFFFYEILTRFAKTAHLYNDSAFAGECKKAAQQLKENIDKYAWDGEWYKRAWFDDGTPLGSSVNDECKMDSIAQSWAALSGGADNGKVNTAMESAYNILVEKDAGIIKLLAPPFDKSDLNPGYIKGYVPGIRENGGQYTHAAVWLIMAFAKLGDNKRVWELLKMINPVNHSQTPETISTYKVEPYVLAADVYAGAQHAGRGGWTWYTGSAGWLYRLITEFFLGMHLVANKLTFVPCIPEEWESYKIQYRYRNTIYHITVLQKNTVENMSVIVDGINQADNFITLTDDGLEHHVQIMLFTVSANSTQSNLNQQKYDSKEI